MIPFCKLCNIASVRRLPPVRPALDSWEWGMPTGLRLMKQPAPSYVQVGAPRAARAAYAEGLARQLVRSTQGRPRWMSRRPIEPRRASQRIRGSTTRANTQDGRLGLQARR